MGVSPLPLDPPTLLATPKLGSIIKINACLFGNPTTPCTTRVSTWATTLKFCSPGHSDYLFSVIKGMTHVYPRGYDAASNPSGIVGADVF